MKSELYTAYKTFKDTLEVAFYRALGFRQFSLRHDRFKAIKYADCIDLVWVAYVADSWKDGR